MCRLLFTNDPKFDLKLFRSSLLKMEHGGPDAPGCIYEYKNYKLGHNRLSILDVSENSNQPYISDDNRYVLIYNGEIYNYKELASQYSICLKNNSDTELLLKLSLKIGFEQALNQLNGMFTYLIFDKITEKFFVARDRLGIKPLYYYQNEDYFIFSSEINSILELLNDSVHIDDVGLRQYKKLRTFFNGHTIYKEIKMFPAGCFFENNRFHRYWELSDEQQAPPSDEELRMLIESSVRYRKVSDVPLGSYLSGGVDSSIVAALAHETHTWTVGFEDNNEFLWARLMANKIGTEHHETITNNSRFLSDLEYMIKKRKEPLSVPNEVLLYEMTLDVKKENTVVLCGEGADELFFGYDRIFKWAYQSKTFDVKEFSKYYSYGSEDDIEIVDDAISPFYRYKKPIDIVAAFFQIAHLHGLLRRVDNSTMLCAVEARVPFVDHRLIERMAGVSFEYRMQNGIIKAPLKRVFKDILPIEIIERSKVGFPVRIDSIFHSTADKKYDAWLEYNMNCLQEVVRCN